MPGSKVAGLALVGVLHIGLIYLLASATARRAIEPPQGPLQVRILGAQERPAQPPAPPPPLLKAPPPVFVPPPEITITAAQNTAATQAITIAKPPPAAAPAPVTTPAARVEPVLDTARSSDPAYPPLSRRLEEQGLVALLVLVGPDGSVQEVRVEKSSGYPRLDDAAIAGARSNCRFRPGTLDGKPASMWYRYQYQFSLS